MKRRKVLAVILSLCLLITTTAGMTTTVAATDHSLTHVEAQAETCTADGNKEYWYCTECGKYFSDSAATAEISQSDTVISAKGHSLTHVEAQGATCTSNGNSEYWYCSECGKYFSDSAATAEISQSDTVISAKGHSLTHIEAQAESCTSDGNSEYWYCSECWKNFSDSAATAEISQSDTIISAKGHSLTHVEAQGATCTSDGNSEYWYCSECGKYFSDSAATAEISQSDTVISAKGHSLTHIEAQAETCTADGNKEYWYCSECWKNFSDSAATAEISQSDTVISAKGHSLTHIEAQAETCTADGNKEYWYCTECGKYFSDAGCTQEITQAETILSALGHTLQHFEAVEAGCDTVGNVEYWYCGDCDTYFSDPDATAEITLSQTVVAATGEHEYEVSAIVWNYEDGTATVKCLECGEYHTFDATVTSKNVLGQKTYTITTTINGTEYTDTKTTGTSLMMVQASYSAVTAAIEKANSLNPDDYENFSAVTDAINAVDWSLSVLNQREVNAYAEAIEEAINNLVPAETVNITEETIEVIDPVEAGETDSE